MMEQFVLSFPFLFIYFLRQTVKSLLAQSVARSTFFHGTQKMNVLRICRVFYYKEAVCLQKTEKLKYFLK